MDSFPVRRRSCLLRLRENCPFRKLCRHTNDVSAAKSSPIGSYWNSKGPPTSNQPISTVYEEALSSPSRCQSVCSHDQSQAAGVFMEEEIQQDRAEDLMDVDDDIDPETGERAQQ